MHMNTDRDRTIEVEGINVRYWAQGNTGSTVVLLHGIGGRLEDWQPTFGSLTAEHRVVALELPGHGLSDKPADYSYSIEDLAAFTRTFLTAVSPGRVTLVGYSLGGAIATRFAIRYPTLVDRLVLIAPAGLGRKVALFFRLASLPGIGELLTRPSRSGAAAAAKMCVFDPTIVDDALIESAYQMSIQPGAREAFLKAVRANANLFGQANSMAQTNLAGVPSVSSPTLVIWGNQDKIIPVTHADVASRLFPNVRVELFDRCGHTPMLEYTGKVNRLLLDFLAEPERENHVTSSDR